MRRRSAKFRLQARAYRGLLLLEGSSMSPEDRAWTEKVIAESERIAKFPWLSAPATAPTPPDAGVPPTPEPLPGVK